VTDIRQHTEMTYEDYLRQYGNLTYTNVGTSMMPLLREGRDLFTVAPKEKRCRVGDVVLYRRPPSRWVLHRVVEVLPEGYLTLGDNCLARERVAEDDVIGVMTGFVRGGRGGRAGRTHSVEEPGYRAYTCMTLAAERPRVFLKRALMAMRRRLSPLRPKTSPSMKPVGSRALDGNFALTEDPADESRLENASAHANSMHSRHASSNGPAEGLRHA